MNTGIHYEYRDGSNYRFHGWFVAAGEMTDQLWARVRAACADGEVFIAHQVGIPEVFGYLPGTHVYSAEHVETGFTYDEDNDHCWHRFHDDPGAWALTNDAPTDERTVEGLVAAFEAAVRTGWQVFDPAERFEL